MLDPTITTGLLQGLQRTINFSLRYDPGTQHQLQQLQGKRICLRCTQPAQVCYLTFDGGAVQLAGYSEDTVDCELAGGLSDLVSLIWRDRQSLAHSGVEVRGDVALLARLQSLIAQLDLDWEEAINDTLGDSAGHLLSQLLRGQVQWWRQRFSEVPHWLPDYLSEELQATPSSFELQRFYTQVQELQQDTERLQARLNKLQQQATGQ